MKLPKNPTLVWRHKKENLKKCSLRGLEGRADFTFLTFPSDPLPDLTNYIVLAVDAPPLTQEDTTAGIFLIDATWRYASIMLERVQLQVKPSQLRSLPNTYRTAYPRRQDDCPDPELGLASLEAIYLCYMLAGWDTTGLLDNYYWKTPFLEKNQLLTK
jgi:pre-rRNA-processing protein TSR3